MKSVLTSASETADWLQAMRQERGLSQAELAQRVRVSQTTISNWERGKAQPDDVQVEFLREAFGQPDIEGLQAASSAGWGGQYPLDAVFVRTEPRSVVEVVRRIKDDRYILQPDFQRDFVWDVVKQSRLIESCLMRIPLPVLYVAEAPDGRIIVVDGLQRLTTFWRFLNNQFKLSLPAGEDGEKHPLEGKRFQDLEIKLQERIEDTPLTLYILDSKAPERAKLDIFERVNGGEPLTRQQMRNCLYNGAATRWLGEAAATDFFKQATGESLDTKKMRDREAVNRFCAFSILGWAAYKSGDMDGFLAEALDKMNRMQARELTSLALRFDWAMRINLELFGQHAFRKSLAGSPSAPRSVLNIALFDVCSVLFGREQWAEGIMGRQDRVKEAIRRLLKDKDFEYAISYSTNNRLQVSNRFSLMERELEQVLA